MALTCPEDYVRLGKHLEEIDAIFQCFLNQSGYANNTGRLGRYPHRSAIFDGRVVRKIDLQMDTDLNGERFDHFFPDIPYMLWAGAWLDEEGYRYADGGCLVFERLPFSKVKEVLADSLPLAAGQLERITESVLKETGTRTKLGIF